jgi:putative transposase
MTRIKRSVVPGEVYHVYGRGNNRQAVFRDAQDYCVFLSAISKFKVEFPFSLFHYALMPNHYHLLIRPGENDVSQFMQKTLLSFSRYYREKYSFVGHVWQGRFRTKRIDDDAQLIACGNYIEMNPVRAKLATKPEEWPYSSYRFYAFGEKNRLIETDPSFMELARTSSRAREAYRTTVTATRVSVN